VRVYAFISDQQTEFPVETLCQVCGVSRSAYYGWVAAEAAGPSPAELDDAAVLERIRRVHKASRGRYGEPRVTAQLAREGSPVNHKRVERLMRENGLQGRCGRKKVRTTIRDPKAAPAADLVERQFEQQRLDVLWVGDVTYIPTGEGFLYLSTVIDACSRRLLGWSITDHLRTELCLDALRAAAGLRGGRAAIDGVIFHSDRGCQYTAEAYREACDQFGITQSMGSVGDSYDKAMVSHCTSGRWLGQSAFVDPASLAFDEAGVAGGGRLEEPHVLVVGLVGREQAGAVPGLDGGDVHAEMLGEFGHGEEAASAESFEVAGQAVAAA
jgi:transposase InsO family protein